MTGTITRFDRAGKPIPPDVKIGNERLHHRIPAISGSGSVACNDHGVSPVCWVRARGSLLVRCCRQCIREHCQIAQAVPAPSVIPLEHSDGH